MKMIFNYDANKTHFHNKGFALSLVLKVRVFGTRKWPIGTAKATSLRVLKLKFHTLNRSWADRGNTLKMNLT